MTIPKKWPTGKDELPKTAAKDLGDLEKEAKSTGDAELTKAVLAAKQKYGNYEQFITGKKVDKAKDMAKTVTDLFNKAVEAVTKAQEKAASASGGKPVYTVKGGVPSPTGMEGADATLTKAKLIIASMKSGKDPHEACKTAGIAERPTIIVRKKDEHWVYEFRLSHGGTQYRLNAEAKSSDGGKNIEVEFKYLGRGH